MTSVKTILSNIAKYTFLTVDILLGAAQLALLIILIISGGSSSLTAILTCLWLFPFVFFIWAFFTKNLFALLGATVHTFLLGLFFSGQWISEWKESGWNIPTLPLVVFYTFLLAGSVLSVVLLIMAKKKVKVKLIKCLSFAPALLFWLCNSGYVACRSAFSDAYGPTVLTMFNDNLIALLFIFITAILSYLVPRGVFFLCKKKKSPVDAK